MTKWIVIGLIIFFVITGIVVPCVLLLGPDNNEDPTTSSPTVAGNLKFHASLFSTTRTILIIPFKHIFLRLYPRGLNYFQNY